MSKQDRKNSAIIFDELLLNNKCYYALFERAEPRSEVVADFIKTNESECNGKLLISQMLFDSIMQDDADKIIAWSLVFVRYINAKPSEDIVLDAQREIERWRSLGEC